MTRHQDSRLYKPALRARRGKADCEKLKVDSEDKGRLALLGKSRRKPAGSHSSTAHTSWRLTLPGDLTCHLPDSDLRLKMGPKSHQNGLVWRIGPRWLMRLVETDKFDVWLVSIRVSMRLLRPRQGAGQEELRIRTGIRLRLGLGL